MCKEESPVPAAFAPTVSDVVQAINRTTADDREVVETLAAMVNRGRARLGGNVAGATIAWSSPARSRRLPPSRVRDHRTRETQRHVETMRRILGNESPGCPAPPGERD